jgi:hypothetical protein
MSHPIMLRKCSEMVMMLVTLKKRINLRKCVVMMKMQMTMVRNFSVYWLTWPLVKMTQ